MKPAVPCGRGCVNPLRHPTLVPDAPSAGPIKPGRGSQLDRKAAVVTGAAAKPDDLAETERQVRAYVRKCLPIQADIRDVGALRAAADRGETEFGTIAGRSTPALSSRSS